VHPSGSSFTQVRAGGRRANGNFGTTLGCKSACKKWQSGGIYPFILKLHVVLGC
jgi:hypothetical protein